MLSNTATPKYYGQFREAVLRGEIPVCETISMEMNRIDELIRDPNIYYDPDPVEGWIAFCENELTLTDGSDVKLLDTFKLWGEQIFGWYYYEERTIYVPAQNSKNGKGHYEKRAVKKRLTNKQFLIIPRSGAKSLYDAFIQAYFLTIDTSTTHQVTTAPTMKQAEEVMSPIRTAIVRARGPYFQFLTLGSLQNTTGNRVNRQKLAATKKGIENFLTNSFLEIRAMSIDKLQGLRCKIATVDEWLSGDTREDPIGAIEQGAAKIQDYLIVATSSEGTIRNGIGDSMKMELMDILKGKYRSPWTSIWYYKLDKIEEVGMPEMWIKAQPNLGVTVTYDTYQREVERAENVPAAKNDILAKRFNIPMEGYTYFFTYEETIPFKKREFWKMPCSLGADLSQGDDFCAFTFLFPLSTGCFGVKTRSYITSLTLNKLPAALRLKYQDFIEEGSLIIMEGNILDMALVYDDLDNHISKCQYDVVSFGFDPYNSLYFVDRWEKENGPYGMLKVPQGVKTESVPLGEIKNLASERMLIFDEGLMSFCMEHCIALEDTNGNRKLYKKRRAEKIDSVAALLDAFVAYKAYKDTYF